jgi:hypothetical protein
VTTAADVPTDHPAPTHLCRTSVLAAMFAVPVCCPPMGLLACIAGAVALRQIRRDATLHGRGLAWAAISVGALSAVVMSWALWTNGLATLWAGPNPPMQALLQASTKTMPKHWSGPAAAMSEEDLAAFAEQLTARYGTFSHAQASERRRTPLEQPGRNPVVSVPITLVFERQRVEADLGLQRFDPKSGSVVMRWRSLRVLDPDRGDLLFPPGEPAPPELPQVPDPAASPSPSTPLR